MVSVQFKYKTDKSIICLHVTPFFGRHLIHNISRETALNTLFITWRLPVPQYFIFVYIQPKQVVPRWICQRFGKHRRCLLFRTPHVAYGRHIVFVRVLLIIIFSSIENNHTTWHLGVLYYGYF